MENIAILKLSRHPHKLLISTQRKKAHIKMGSYAERVLLKMQLYVTLYQFYHMKPKWWTTNVHVGYMHDLYQTTHNSDKGTYWDRIWHSPNLSVPLGEEGDAPCLAGLAELKLAHCCTPSTPLQGTAPWVKRTASSQPLLPATLPSSPSSPELLYSLLLPLFILVIQNCPRCPKS